MRQVTTICKVQQEPTRALEWFLHSFATWNYEKKIEEIKWQRVKCAKSQISKSSTMFHYPRLPLFVWELGTCEPICNSTCSCVRADNDVDGKCTLCRRNVLDWDHVQIFGGSLSLLDHCSYHSYDSYASYDWYYDMTWLPFHVHMFYIFVLGFVPVAKPKCGTSFSVSAFTGFALT